MDRMAQTALNSLKMLMENQAATSHNLSNLSYSRLQPGCCYRFWFNLFE